jgi:cytochrome c peroxidase
MRNTFGWLLGVVGLLSLPFFLLAGDHGFGVSAGARSAVAAGPRSEWPEPISPLSPAPGARAELVALGARLFSDRRLSAGASLSCASCHRLEAGGGDGRRRGVGINGEELLFNVPSIFNAWKNYRYNWRGNFATLEDQNEAILLDPHVMGSSWPSILSALGRDLDYAAGFRELFGEAPDRNGVLAALGAFQRSLTTQDGRFDRYLRGETGAITPEEEEGYALFKSYGCVSCHQGENVGGNLMQRFPLFPPGLAPTEGKASRAARTADLGRFTVTGRSEDRQLFRVPSLRNVAMTAPYFHDGRAATLPEAVGEMAASQLGRPIPDSDVQLIVKFLTTLSGAPPGRPPANQIP